MNAHFQKNFALSLKEFLDSPTGKNLLGALQSGRPPESLPESIGIHQHLFLESRGAIRGYDQCLRNIIALSHPAVMKESVEADYGVKDEKKKEEAPVPITKPFMPQ